MFDDLKELYQEVILDHARHPRHGKKLECYDATAKGDNPMCGDKIELWLKTDADGRIVDLGFEARGCAISVASADLMAEAVIGRTPGEARALSSAFGDLVKTGCSAAFDQEQALASLLALKGVRDYPSRVKCATLAWHALQAALAQTGDREEP